MILVYFAAAKGIILILQTLVVFVFSACPGLVLQVWILPICPKIQLLSNNSRRRCNSQKKKVSVHITSVRRVVPPIRSFGGSNQHVRSILTSRLLLCIIIYIVVSPVCRVLVTSTAGLYLAYIHPSTHFLYILRTTRFHFKEELILRGYICYDKVWKQLKFRINLHRRHKRERVKKCNVRTEMQSFVQEGRHAIYSRYGCSSFCQNM